MVPVLCSSSGVYLLAGLALCLVPLRNATVPGKKKKGISPVYQCCFKTSESAPM